MTEQQPKKLHGTAFRAVTAIVAVMLLFTSTATTLAYAQTVRTVTVTDGDSTKVISTDSTSPEEIIRQAGFMLSANDAVDASGLTSAGGILKISRAKTVKVIDNNDIVYCIGYDTLGKTLEDRGFGAVEEYSPEMPLDEDVYNGMEVVLVRAFPVTIVADGEEQKLYTMGSTVSELLDKAGVEVGEDDKVSQAPEADISGSSTITVDRVEYVERTVKEDIPFKAETKKTNDLYEDETKVVTAGVNGEKEIVYKDTVVNGEVTETVKVSETVTKEPVNEVKNEGTKKRPALINFKDGTEPISDLDVPAKVKLDENGLPKKYVDYIEGEATAYAGDTATSTGMVPMQGVVAVDPREIPYGSELYIVSKDGKYIYGYAIAADTGGFIYTTDTVVDLFMDSEEMCDEWGRRDVAIYVISYGDNQR